jgi:hypothetical protein
MPKPSGGFTVSTLTLRSESRDRITLLTASRAREAGLLMMCGWCKRVHLSGYWAEVEEAVPSLRLFERAQQPNVTHVICEECHLRMATLLEGDISNRQ